MIDFTQNMAFWSIWIPIGLILCLGSVGGLIMTAANVAGLHWHPRATIMTASICTMLLLILFGVADSFSNNNMPSKLVADTYGISNVSCVNNKGNDLDDSRRLNDGYYECKWIFDDDLHQDTLAITDSKANLFEGIKLVEAVK